MPDPVETLLVISPIGLPSYAARGIKQTLANSASSQNMRRTVNGQMVNLAPSQLQKYKSTLTCDDMESPALDGIWPGATLTINCITELAYLTAGGSPQRPVVSGSARTEGSFSFYRPVLTMMVVDFKIETDEWGAKVGWQAELEEV